MNMSFINYAAKAVAALVVPWVLFAAAWAADNLGIEIPLEAGAVETAVVSAITGVAVYLKRNTPQAQGAS